MSVHYGSEWARLSKRHLRFFPRCAVVGCAAQAKHVDHIVPVKVAPSRRLDPANLQSLCAACHNRITSAYDRGSIAGACNVNGEPLDPSHPWAQADNARAIDIVNNPVRADPIVAARLKRNAVRGRPR